MINARLRAIDSDIDVQLLQARNAGLDFVAETLPVIGKNQVIKRSILRTARQHGATVALADATARTFSQSCVRRSV
ncbi:MAG: hypothetical protein ACXW3N_13535 [Rhodoplanes sp.]|jgi:hypothetical protein